MGGCPEGRAVFGEKLASAEVIERGSCHPVESSKFVDFPISESNGLEAEQAVIAERRTFNYNGLSTSHRIRTKTGIA